MVCVPSDRELICMIVPLLILLAFNERMQLAEVFLSSIHPHPKSPTLLLALHGLVHTWSVLKADHIDSHATALSRRDERSIVAYVVQ